MATQDPPEVTLDPDAPACGQFVAKDEAGHDIVCDLPEGHPPPCSAPADLAPDH